MKWITKDYIRGFFDGEGYFGFTWYPTPTRKGTETTHPITKIQIVNCEYDLLDNISKALTTFGIRNRLNLVKDYGGRLGKNPQPVYSIYIESYEQINNFWKIIGSNNPKHIKKADQFIKYYKKVVKKRKRIAEDKINITNLCNTGKTHYRIKIIYPHLSHSQLDGFCKGIKHLKVNSVTAN